MTFREHLAPRSPTAAVRASAAFAITGAVLLSGLTLTVPTFAPTGTARTVALCAAAALVVLGGLQLRVPHRLPFWFWVTVPTQAVAMVTALDLMTHDASAAGQAFFIWPVLFGAYEMRSRVAVAVLVQVLLGQAVVAFSVLDTLAAVTDVVCVGVTLSVLCLLLVRARENEARVVSQLERRAATDPLTGLATRRVLDEAAQAALLAPAGESTLALFDVDRFKEINDELGHPAGDAVLVHVAALLRAEAGPDALVARLGGDEFAALLPGSSAEEGMVLAETFRSRLLRQPAVAPGGPVTVTVSVGVASARGGPQAELYVAADEALYSAKRAGRNRAHHAASLPAPPPGTPVPAT